MGEGEILQFDLEALHAEPFGQRRVYLHRLGGDTAALVEVGEVMQRPHVVQPVGQLDQEHADVVRHRQQELAEILGFAARLRTQLDLRELGDTVDQLRHFLAEEVLDLLQGGDRVLDRVVQQGGDDGGAIQAIFGQDAGNLERMGEVRIARGAGLRAVRHHGKDVGAIQQLLVRSRIVGTDLLDEFILPDHWPSGDVHGLSKS